MFYVNFTKSIQLTPVLEYLHMQNLQAVNYNPKTLNQLSFDKIKV